MDNAPESRQLRAENDELRRAVKALAAIVIQLCVEYGVDVPEPVTG